MNLLFEHGFKEGLRDLLKGNTLKATLIRDSIGSLAFRSLDVLVSFAMGVVLARALGAEDYGIFGYVTALITVLRVPAEFGLPTLVMRETAKNIAKSQWNLVKGMWRWATLMIGSLTAILIVGVLISSEIWGAKFSPQQIDTLYWGLLLIPLISLGRLRAAQLRGVNKVLLGNLPELILTPTFVILLVFAAKAILARHLDAADAMVINSIAAAGAFIIGAILLVKNTPPEVKPASPTYMGKSWFVSALSLAGVNGLNVISKQVSILILGFYVTSSADIGVYKTAIQFSTLAAFGLQVITMVISPQLAMMFARNEKKRMQRVVTVSTRVILLINFLIMLVMIFLGKPILKLTYGPEYVGAYLPLTIILVGQTINSATGTVAPLLNMGDKEKSTVLAVAISTVVNIGLNMLLSPKYGINGAAIATSISLIVLNVLLWWMVKKSFGINSLPFTFGKHNKKGE
jgi:O-antigen/teichoic acid export membrane protein